jgi:hypothetical protein
MSGSGMEISHTGKSLIHTPTHTLKLCNILHVLKSTKNMLSIHCFALDNNIFFEIHPCCFSNQGLAHEEHSAERRVSW